MSFHAAWRRTETKRRQADDSTMRGDRAGKGKALESILGCGTGLCGIYFRDLAKELIGVDLIPKMLEKAKTLGAYDSLFVADALEYLNRAALENFDLIIAADVFSLF